jgi:hypothetical protein
MIVLSAAIGWLGRSSHQTFSWDVAVSTATAYGTLFLALVTWRLVSSARDDAAGTLELAQLATRDQEAQLRPCVYPFFNRHVELERDGLTVLPLQNGGQGLALNVTGQIYCSSGNCALASTTLHPADNVQLPIRGSIPINVGDEIWGRIEYRDLLGRAWETRFVVEVGPDKLPRPSIRAYGRTEGLSPNAYPGGWELKNGAPWLALEDLAITS